ncbi:MAG: protein kinase [Cyanobacteria bacterium HKST-UBA02]|nr:protein kinase [Cyanobacteria bacterium HKST-UBA02]
MRTNQSPPVDLLEKLGSRYSELEFLDRGGMGAIYRAHDSILDKQVAIKTLACHGTDNLLRFQSEARIASQLEHPAIVRTLDFGITESNLPYLIMDFVPGKSLEHILAESGPLAWENAVGIAARIAGAMAFAHSKGISHRDLKTSNILIDGSRITVIDFGLARELEEKNGEESHRMTSVGAVLGSPLYMSPEQAHGEAGDHRSDIYSLGCILYRSLTGGAPFQSDDYLTLMNLKDSPPPRLAPPDESSSWPSSLADIVERTLATAPEDRYQSMSELESDLSALLAQEPSGSHAAMPVPGEKEGLKMPSRTVLLGTVAGLILITIAAFYLYLTVPGQNLRKPKPAEFQETLFMGEKIGRFSIERDPEFDRLACLTAITPSAITDADLAALPAEIAGAREKNTRVEGLDLSKTRVKGSGLRYLQKQGLKAIDLDDTAIEPQYLSYLKLLKKQERLISLSGVKITPEHIKVLSSIGAIHELRLNRSATVDDAIVGELASMKIRRLGLSGTKITDRGLALLDKSERIGYLDLSNTEISDQGLERIGDLELKGLQISYCPNLTGRSLEIIARQWPELEVLNIDSLKSTDQQFAALSNLKDLRIFQALNIPLSDTDMEAITQCPKLTTFYNTGGLFTARGLNKLLKLKELNAISILSLKNIKERDFEAFRQKLPKGLSLLSDFKSSGTVPDELQDIVKGSTDMFLDDEDNERF